jgi:hypothetical protein
MDRRIHEAACVPAPVPVARILRPMFVGSRPVSSGRVVRPTIMRVHSERWNARSC